MQYVEIIERYVCVCVCGVNGLRGNRAFHRVKFSRFLEKTRQNPKSARAAEEWLMSHSRVAHIHMQIPIDMTTFTYCIYSL